jgi:hypothetical protein
MMKQTKPEGPRLRYVYRVVVEKVEFTALQEGDVFALVDPADAKTSNEDGKALYRAGERCDDKEPGVPGVQASVVGVLSEPITGFSVLTTEESKQLHAKLEPFKELWDAPGMEAYDGLGD